MTQKCYGCLFLIYLCRSLLIQKLVHILFADWALALTEKDAFLSLGSELVEQVTVYLEDGIIGITEH